MQHRQLRLGDILDDYCPRERRLTNHAIVAMVGAEVKQTRCTTCDAEHEYKHAKVPRQRRKAEAPAALYSQVLASGPKRVVHEADGAGDEDLSAIVEEERSVGEEEQPVPALAPPAPEPQPAAAAPEAGASPEAGEDHQREDEDAIEEGPVHRPLIRATLPRPEGQAPPTRPGPDFTIRQPGNRSNRFRPRHQRGGSFAGNRNNGNMAGGPMRSGGGSMRGGPRPTGGRPPIGSPGSRMGRRHGPGRKRSK